MTDEDVPQTPPNLVDLMGALIPPPEPAPISLMPQTWGWPVLVVVLAGLVAYVAHRLRQTRQAEAYRGAALAALEEAGTAPAEVALVLRQAALAAYPRAQVASLHGQDWLSFLQKTGGQPGFCAPEGEALITQPYKEASPLPQASLALVRDWIRHHDRTIRP